MKTPLSHCCKAPVSDFGNCKKCKKLCIEIFSDKPSTPATVFEKCMQSFDGKFATTNCTHGLGYSMSPQPTTASIVVKTFITTTLTAVLKAELDQIGEDEPISDPEFDSYHYKRPFVYINQERQRIRHLITDLIANLETK